MPETYLYQKIAEAIRQDILSGELKPGDRLPPLRQMTSRWGCTTGTVQRAYHELTQAGLVVSRAGQGTKVGRATCGSCGVWGVDFLAPRTQEQEPVGKAAAKALAGMYRSGHLGVMPVAE